MNPQTPQNPMQPHGNNPHDQPQPHAQPPQPAPAQPPHQGMPQPQHPPAPHHPTGTVNAPNHAMPNHSPHNAAHEPQPQQHAPVGQAPNMMPPITQNGGGKSIPKIAIFAVVFGLLLLIVIAIAALSGGSGDDVASNTSTPSEPEPTSTPTTSLSPTEEIYTANTEAQQNGERSTGTFTFENKRELERVCIKGDYPQGAVASQTGFKKVASFEQFSDDAYFDRSSSLTLPQAHDLDYVYEQGVEEVAGYKRTEPAEELVDFVTCINWTTNSTPVAGETCDLRTGFTDETIETFNLVQRQYQVEIHDLFSQQVVETQTVNGDGKCPRSGKLVEGSTDTVYDDGVDEDEVSDVLKAFLESNG